MGLESTNQGHWSSGRGPYYFSVIVEAGLTGFFLWMAHKKKPWLGEQMERLDSTVVNAICTALYTFGLRRASRAPGLDLYRSYMCFIALNSRWTSRCSRSAILLDSPFLQPHITRTSSSPSERSPTTHETERVRANCFVW